MSVRTDGLLAVAVLLAVAFAIVATDASVSRAWLVLGGFGTLLLEAAMATRADAVRRYWNRRAVRLVSFAAAIAAVVAGAVVAPGPVLSAGLGAAVTYLVVLGLVVVDVLKPATEWRD